MMIHLFKRPLLLSITLAAGAFLSRAASPATFNIAARDLPAQLVSVAVGDLNHDGIPDIVGASTNSDQILVYIAKGSGAITAPVSYLVGGIPSAVALADIDGDGNLDIVALDPEPGEVSILYGTGTGTFRPAVPFAIVGTPSSLAIGDVNGDGKPDIVISDRASRISLLLSSPAGFLPVTQIAVGGTPQQVNLADFNGDGKLDIAELDEFSGNALILFGNGDGTFRIGPSTSFGISGAFGARDLNGDGFADLIGPNNNIAGAVLVLLGKGDGTFQPPVKYRTASFPGDIAFGDFNADGMVDLITSNFGVGGATVLLGNGDGTFGDALFSAAPIGSGSVAVGDLTGDRKLDAVIANTDYLSVLRGRGNGYFAAPPHYDLAQQALPLCFATADFNGDGKPDLVTGTYLGAYSLWIQLGNGDSTFQPAIQIPLSEQPNSLAVADFNHDGKPDIAVLESYGGSSFWVEIFMGNGNGTFQAPISVISANLLEGLTAADFNHDGHIDILVSTPESILVLPGNGDGTFQTPVATAVPSGLYFTIAGDFNHDGKLDLAAISETARLKDVVEVLLGNGDGTFQPPTPYAVGKGAVSMVSIDLNGDGILDLATANIGVTGSTEIPGTISVFLGKGDGTFQSEVSYFSGFNTYAIAAADLNGDGFPDLVAPNYLDNNLVIFLGAGDGTFSPQMGRFGVGYQPEHVVIADFNGDGKPDVAVANQGSVSVLTNMTSQ